MEIAPIPGIRSIAAAQPRSNGFDVPAVFAVPEPSRSGDDTYNGKGKAAAGGQDNEDELAEGEDDEMEEASFGEEATEEPMPRRASGSPVDFFA